MRKWVLWMLWQRELEKLLKLAWEEQFETIFEIFILDFVYFLIKQAHGFFFSPPTSPTPRLFPHFYTLESEKHFTDHQCWYKLAKLLCANKMAYPQDKYVWIKYMWVTEKWRKKGESRVSRELLGSLLREICGRIPWHGWLLRVQRKLLFSTAFCKASTDSSPFFYFFF